MTDKTSAVVWCSESIDATTIVHKKRKLPALLVDTTTREISPLDSIYLFLPYYGTLRSYHEWWWFDGSSNGTGLIVGIRGIVLFLILRDVCWHTIGCVFLRGLDLSGTVRVFGIWIGLLLEEVCVWFAFFALLTFCVSQLTCIG